MGTPSSVSNSMFRRNINRALTTPSGLPSDYSNRMRRSLRLIYVFVIGSSLSYAELQYSIAQVMHDYKQSRVVPADFQRLNRETTTYAMACFGAHLVWQIGSLRIYYARRVLKVFRFNPLSQMGQNNRFFFYLILFFSWNGFVDTTSYI